VLVLGTIIALAFLASFVNVPVPSEPNGVVNNGSGTFTGSYSLPKPKYVYNLTIVLSPDLTDLQYTKSNYSDLPPPYYTVPHTNNTILFNFTEPANNTLKLLLKALAWNVTKIAPKAYGDLLSIADSAYVIVTNYTNVTLEPFPLNPNDTENYSKWEIIVVYAKEFEPPGGFQPGWSYPPSDSVTVHPLSYRVINKTTIQTDVQLSYDAFKYLEY